MFVLAVLKFSLDEKLLMLNIFEFAQFAHCMHWIC